MKNRRADILLISVLLAAGVAAGLIVLLTRKPGAKVTVRVGGEVRAEFPLGEDTEYDIVSENGVNRLIIKNGEAWIESASCPDGLCVNMGHIRYTGSSVICLPNKVVVEIISDGGVDAVTGR